ncbi:hypothetical protein SLEP1_g16619 [Rubroshorea leprosula]|uniref:Uncharacterized protein n=1 Tax=Rubroshorea leprosula TaxID=152421 RepID=A0AAV5IXF8_9ROSI|nr:hypothetical protein SLEP1_g16619 [Rubroshorea leprosula]
MNPKFAGTKRRKNRERRRFRNPETAASLRRLWEEFLLT